MHGRRPEGGRRGHAEATRSGAAVATSGCKKRALLSKLLDTERYLKDSEATNEL